MVQLCLSGDSMAADTDDIRCNIPQILMFFFNVWTEGEKGKDQTMENLEVGALLKSLLQTQT